MPSHDVEDAWQRYRRDGGYLAFERLVALTRPLVASVCRRVLLREVDVDDAVQQTYARLLQRGEGVSMSIEAWLVVAARNVCIDVVRREARERKRRERVARGDVDRAADYRRELLRLRLPTAMAALDEADRAILRERFFAGEPLRVLAARANVTTSTMSRRVSAALGRLAGVLGELGVADADALVLASLFGDPTAVERAAGGVAEHEGLRVASDWRTALGRVASLGGDHLPGWTRPVRVGVFVSYDSIVTPFDGNKFAAPADWQVSLTQWMNRGPVELVGLVEPGTSARGPIEVALREHELTAGLIYADDLEGLRTLDVINLGVNYHARPAVVRAIRLAVEEGVGLHNEAFTGTETIPPDNDDLRAIYLSATPVESYHTSPHNMLVPAIFERPHPAVPSAGERAAYAASCTLIFTPKPDAIVVYSKRMIGMAGQRHHPAITEGCRMPTVLICGTLGRGRVVVNGFLMNERLAENLSSPMDRAVPDLLAWLAEPRRGTGEVDS